MKRRGKRQVRSDAGFTLIELIVAAGIVGVGMAMAMGSLISVSTAQRTTEADAMATALLSSVMEEVRNTSAIGDVYEYVAPNITNLGLGASAVATVACVDATNTEVPLPLADGAALPVLPNPAEIRVTVQWLDQDGRVRQVQASTFHRRL